MSASPSGDYLADRRALRRKLTFWRVGAFALAAAALVTLALATPVFGPLRPGSQHIARYEISGLITGDRGTLKTLRDIGESRAAAVIVSIDSPGGTTAGSERVYDELRRLSRKKPVVAVVGTLAASGGYIAALGADQIVADRNSLIGSIGVLIQYPEFTRLLDTVGVKIDSVKSSPLKASPSGVEPTPPEARAALASLVADSYEWFKGLVKERRNLDDRQLAVVADGRVFTAHQGLPLKLVDRLGGEREAIAWLESEKKISKDLPIRDWKRSTRYDSTSLLSGAAAVADAAGFDWAAAVLRQAGTSVDSARFDGLVSIWQVR